MSGPVEVLIRCAGCDNVYQSEILSVPPRAAWGDWMCGRVAASLASEHDCLGALEFDSPCRVMMPDGEWFAARFVAWVADGLAASVLVGPERRVMSVGRTNLRAGSGASAVPS